MGRRNGAIVPLKASRAAVRGFPGPQPADTMGMVALPVLFGLPCAHAYRPMSARPQILVVLPSLVLLAGCQRQLGELPAAAVSRPVVSVQAEDEEVPLPPADTGPVAITWEELDVGIQAETVYEPWMMKTSIKS